MKKILGLSFAMAAILLVGCTSGPTVSEDEAKELAANFINANLMQPGTTATVKSVEARGGMFKLTVEAGGQEIVSFMSGDGKNFFPSVMNMDEVAEKKAAEPAAAAAETTKADKPVVEAYVMSHCPFGTQIEKGLIPVVKALGDTIDFELKFVNYAMHQAKEVNEQTAQYCIQKEQTEKFIPYLECFLGTDGGDDAGATCLAELEIDSDAMATCVAAADEEFGIQAQLEDKASWLNGRFPKFMIHNDDNIKYGVQGSPSLVINGAKVASGRDSVSLMNLICSSFNEKPEACDAEMPAAAPAAGFGWEGTGANTDASCG